LWVLFILIIGVRRFFELFINVVIVPYARNNKQQTSKAKETEEEVPPVNSE